MMAVFFNDPKRNGDFLADRADRAGDEVIGALLEYELGARALRYQMFDPNVVNDSGWLLAQDLFAAHLKGEKMRTRKLCAASGLPQTTVLRYLDHLERLEFVRREGDPDDSRVTLIRLTDWGAYWMREYYSRVLASEERSAAKGQGLFALRRAVGRKIFGDA
jgi:hypothetical protein